MQNFGYFSAHTNFSLEVNISIANINVSIFDHIVLE